ncbi:MAG: GGDEF domain-containing protein, partial [Hydrogenovibrio crunogenus]|nr:GGDEF domain-containing protein [Hydrogenovibrio crunogenus]
DKDEKTCLTSHAGVTELREASEDSQILFKRVNKAIKALDGTREKTKIL